MEEVAEATTQGHVGQSAGQKLSKDDRKTRGTSEQKRKRTDETRQRGAEELEI